MLIRALYIFILNLLTYGGGGVYIPVYEHYYTQVFHLMSQNDYYNVVSILNIIPGVTGGKLAGYAMFLEFGYLGMIIGIIIFAGSGIMLVLLLDKMLMQIKDHPIFLEVNKNIKPVVGGILLSITYDFYTMAATKLSLIMIAIITMIVIYLLVIKQTKIFIVVSSFFVLFGIICVFIL